MTAAAAVFSSDLLLAKNEPTRALAEAKRAEREEEGGYVALEAMFQMALAHARLEQWDEAQSAAQELRRKAESIPGERDKRSYRWLLGEIALARAIRRRRSRSSIERARCFRHGASHFMARERLLPTFRCGSRWPTRICRPAMTITPRFGLLGSPKAPPSISLRLSHTFEASTFSRRSTKSAARWMRRAITTGSSWNSGTTAISTATAWKRQGVKSSLTIEAALQIDERTRKFIHSHRVARLATVDAKGQPAVIPICYVFEGKRFYSAIDENPSPSLGASQASPEHRSESTCFACHRRLLGRLVTAGLRSGAGLAEAIEPGGRFANEHSKAVDLLRGKYPQYRSMAIGRRLIIRIEVTSVKHWSSVRD